jgi:hypothetical protein
MFYQIFPTFQLPILPFLERDSALGQHYSIMATMNVTFFLTLNLPGITPRKIIEMPLIK